MIVCTIAVRVGDAEHRRQFGIERGYAGSALPAALRHAAAMGGKLVRGPRGLVDMESERDADVPWLGLEGAAKVRPMGGVLSWRRE